jgi:hypothetical protein
MEEALLRSLDRRWTPTPEVPVYRPARGVVDLVLDDRTANLLVEAEIHGQLRQLEQQVRWQREKVLSLPSCAQGRCPIPRAPEPSTSRLLLLRSCSTLRQMATAFEATLRAAYPTRTADVVAALGTRNTPWPGAGIAWIWIDGKDTRLLDGPPRGVRLGR